MYCKYCGSPLPDDGQNSCPACGKTLFEETREHHSVQPADAESAASAKPEPPTPINSTAYLIWSILATVMCCIPLGIPAIIYATKIDKEWALGNYDEAQLNAKRAKNFAIGSAVAALVVWVVYLIIIVAYALIGVGLAIY